MLGLKPIPSDIEILDQCPMVRLADLVLRYAANHGPLRLTKSGAFKRVFVKFAYEALGFYNCDIEEYGRNNVRNEASFGMLEVAHQVLIDIDAGEHLRGCFRITELGKSLQTQPKELYRRFFPQFLFVINHAYYGGLEDNPQRDWDAALNTIDQLPDGSSFIDLCVAIGNPTTQNHNPKNNLLAEVDFGILRPLTWIGMLDQRFTKIEGVGVYTYHRTKLWSGIFELNSDLVDGTASKS